MEPIKIKKSKQGSFTEWAHAHGFTNVQAAASHVMSNRGKYSDSLVKKANFAKNIGGGSTSRPPSMLESMAHNI